MATVTNEPIIIVNIHKTLFSPINKLVRILSFTNERISNTMKKLLNVNTKNPKTESNNLFGNCLSVFNTRFLRVF